MVDLTSRRPTQWQWLANPIRLSGFLSLFFLAGPGSLYGLSLLLIHAGAKPIVTPVAPQLHALLQSVGFFLILIWGFLVHGLPGMLGAKPFRTRWMRIPMLVTAAGLGLVWAGAAWGFGQVWPHAGWIVLFLGTFSGSAILLHSAFLTQGRWLHRPMPMVVFPMAIPPFAILVSWLTPEWIYLSGAEIALWGCLIPVILAMGYRMFPSMLGLEYPREKWFDAASLVWAAGFAGNLFLPPGSPWGWSADAALLIASVLFVVAMRVAERPRDVLAEGRLPELDRSLMLHVRIAFLFMVASCAVSLAAHTVTDSVFYVKDLARHFMVIGFCLILVSGLTERVFPSFLRSKSSSAGWMNLNLALLTAGLLLRTGEIFLPASALVVRVAGYLLYAGVLGYAAHILRGMTLPHHKHAAGKKHNSTFMTIPGKLKGMKKILAVISFLSLTVFLGVMLRWEFVFGWLSAHGLNFTNVRHAHSHTGYYGVLILPWVWALQSEGLAIPAWLVAAYAAAAFVAGILFVFTGYGLLTITLSTVVLAFWIYVCVKRLRRGATGSWMDATAWAVLMGSTMIPPIAVMANRNPELSASLAHLFLSVLLLGAFVPTAWSLLGLRRAYPVWVWLLVVLGASLQFSFPQWVPVAGPIFVIALAGFLLGSTRGIQSRPVLMAYWTALPVFIGLSAFLPALQDYTARIAGIHFIVLGPLIGSFAVLFPGVRAIPRMLAAGYHLALGAMLGALFFGPMLWPAQAAVVTAIVSTGFAVVLLLCAVTALARERAVPARSLLS